MAPVPSGPLIKMRLDHRTVITVANPKALAMWQTRYPKAEIIG